MTVALTLAACGTVQGAEGTNDVADTTSPPIAGACAPDHPDCEDTVVVPDEGDEGTVDDEIRYRPIEPEGDVAGEGRVLSDGTLVSAEGNSITIGFWMGVETCYAVERVDVTETDSQVSVDIIVAARDVDAACIEIAEARSVTVELGEPLGDRTLQVGDVVIAG